MKFRVLLVGNYRPDAQMSMLRYFEMLLAALNERGVSVTGIEPSAFIGKLRAGPLTKWLRYIDKYLIFPTVLRRKIAALDSDAKRAGERLIVHITDHSNAPYLSSTSGQLVVATCHDLLAVRGALGEDTDCPASRMGKILQAKILASLRRVSLVICVSKATQSDLTRLAPEVHSTSIPLPLNQPFSVLAEDEVSQRLALLDPRLLTLPYILHVGSSLRRKNREGILRIFARAAEWFEGPLVFAGEKLHPEQRELAATLGVSDRVIEIESPSSSVIEALYNRAYAFLFPSKTEGFGWPIIEAQACGCPVLAAKTTSLPEVLGEGGLLRDLSDEAGFAEDLLTLRDATYRSNLIEKGFTNVARFGTRKIIDTYREAYRSLLH